MDGRTDRILIARPRLHSMQRGKNAHDLFCLTGESHCQVYERLPQRLQACVSANGGHFEYIM